MKKSLLYFLLFTISIQMLHAQKVRIKTSEGTIIVELYAQKAPITVANFMRYVDEQRYDGGKFYRVVRLDNQANNATKIEVIQGGLQTDSTKMLPTIEQETTNKTGILHLDGTISMARVKPESAASEFFICINPQPELDFGGKRNPDWQGFAAFGRVIKGMKVVRKIQMGETGTPAPTNAYSNPTQYLKNPIIIKTIKRISSE